jgi:DNA repair protein RecO (recombination protein O)
MGEKTFSDSPNHRITDSILMSLHQTEAIVLKTTDFLEYDKLVTLYTRKLGKVRAVAKGVRKPTSKLAASLGLFAELKITLFGKRPRELYRLTQTEIIRFHHRLREDVDRLTYSSLFIELLNRASGENEPDPELYQFCSEYLTGLEKKVEVGSFTLIYLIKLFQITGFAPYLSGCVVCRKLVPTQKKTNFHFNFHKGGIVCSNCLSKIPNPGQRIKGKPVQSLSPISIGSIQFYQTALSEPISRLAELTIDRKQGKVLLELLLNHIAYHLEGSLKSQKFYQTIYR